MGPSRLVVGVALLASLGGATTLACDGDDETDAGKGGSPNGGSSNGGSSNGGSSGEAGGSDEAGSSSGGNATGGRGNGGRGGSGGTDATGGSAGSTWDMVGGCPSELCPSMGLPDGDTCSVTVTCCQYQRLSESQNCTCTNGEWVCEAQRCACP